MTDRVSPEKRSEIMSRVHAKNTAPEITVRKLVFALGYRYRLHSKTLPGHPDLVFPSRRKVIFVHGCFWHFHGCKKGQPPKSNLDYWLPKFEENRKRDSKALSDLTALGWSYLVIWQCQLKNTEFLKNEIRTFLQS
ncbi:very short patch repair endonuclease [Methylocaldum gracile]